MAFAAHPHKTKINVEKNNVFLYLQEIPLKWPDYIEAWYRDIETVALAAVPSKAVVLLLLIRC